MHIYTYTHIQHIRIYLHFPSLIPIPYHHGCGPSPPRAQNEVLRLFDQVFRQDWAFLNHIPSTNEEGMRGGVVRRSIERGCEHATWLMGAHSVSPDSSSLR